MATSGEALHQLKATDPTHWLTPSTTLSQTARAASQYLFSSLKPYTPKTPFDQLLVDGFDAEQIWQQIDLQSQPLLSSIKRDLKRFQKNPDELRKLKVVVGGEEKILDVGIEEFDVERDDFDEDIHGLDDDDDDDDEDNDEEEEAGGKEGKVEKENTSDKGESEGEDKESEGEDEEAEGGDGSGAGIEDEFLKLKDLEDFLEDDEAREYGLKKKKAKNMNDKKKDDDESLDEEDGEDEEAEDEDDSDEFGDLGLGDDGDEETEKLENARYEEFFGTKKKKSSQRKSKPIEDSEDNDEEFENQNNFSTHEKELMKRKSEIEKLEREKLEPKAWTMQGEVAAANRPKNSALEVDIDFKHNMRPPPVITEEFTASIEEMIYKRILEGHFDDVQKAPTIHSKAPREIKELDETKSKKGLGEVYEEEYVQKTNLASAPLSTTDELKKEASMLFKKLCLKLDALSHFHFTPKPVIEDMSIQVNVPALAMEETAPVAVSDAAMLAPEEVFAGKGDIKDEGELTQAERKRRRANKKRKYKVETVKRMAKKPRDNNLQNHKEDS